MKICHTTTLRLCGSLRLCEKYLQKDITQRREGRRERGEGAGSEEETKIYYTTNSASLRFFAPLLEIF